MGETVMDILFHEQTTNDTKNNSEYVPFAAVPGGSSFNSMISVGRSGVPSIFIGYTGDNMVGRQIADFLQSNGISTEYFQKRRGEKAALSLAYLDANGDANYCFYKEEPSSSEEYSFPCFTSMDYMLYGSFFAICPGLRTQVRTTLQAAHKAGTLIYYDINFRRTYKHRINELLPVIQENCRLSSIVRGSADDFEILFGTRNPEEIYHNHISSHCPVFICTSGSGRINIFTPTGRHDYDVPQIPAEEIVSTVGAGDSFNAGFLCALHQQGIRKTDLPSLQICTWQSLVANGIQYSSQVCRSQYNYIDKR